MTRSSPQLSLVAVAYRYGRHSVLDRVDLAVRPSERVGILGRSGVGKSTLLQILAGLVAPSSGTVRVDGAPVRGPVPGCTVMFQRPALLPWASVLDNVLLPARLAGRLGRERADSAAEAHRLLDDLGLAERAQAKPHQLSGGQQQRVALARALASRPRILLLDEPFSALDPEMRGALRTDVLRLARERGLTLIVVTHDLADVAALAQRAVVLSGRPARVSDDFLLSDDAEAELRRRLGPSAPERAAA
ncbi:ABC transporter ATP-binding protein [Methylobacterium soli]|uniref:ATP-binding cassette domain-containing protein n=1 Tax=Methylobacterium soli TaxID=553447 RepID=A0A6L3T054_9HYPH|nr:ATP-binding cassette domain-containing protein [Methylobacterium soli]KAB1079305.1 ATP-binding cassette domain-containing protein [Methylobacterium soli]GJE43407.1 Bicarbonate transport ATP-binding protein CmpD [Methylobacterium soli]